MFALRRTDMIQEITGGFHEDRKERRKKIYMSEGTRKILDEKRMTEIAFSADGSEINRKKMKSMQRKLRRRLIRDREKWWKMKAREIEKNMKRNSMGKVFEVLNLQKRAKNKISVIRDKDGARLEEEAKQLME